MTHPVYVDSLQYKYLLTSQTILKIQKQIVHSLKKQRETPPSHSLTLSHKHNTHILFYSQPVTLTSTCFHTHTLSLTHTFLQTQHTHIILLPATHSYTHMLSYTHSLTL